MDHSEITDTSVQLIASSPRDIKILIIPETADGRRGATDDMDFHSQVLGGQGAGHLQVASPSPIPIPVRQLPRRFFPSDTPLCPPSSPLHRAACLTLHMHPIRSYSHVFCCHLQYGYLAEGALCGECDGLGKPGLVVASRAHLVRNISEVNLAAVQRARGKDSPRLYKSGHDYGSVRYGMV